MSESRACAHRGFPGTWEAHLSPPKGKVSGMGLPAPKAPGLVLSCLTVTEANLQALRGYGQAITRSQPDGKVGVGVAHSTEEGGEPARRDPLEGRGDQPSEPREGNMAGTQEPVSMYTSQLRIAAPGVQQ